MKARLLQIYSIGKSFSVLAGIFSLMVLGTAKEVLSKDYAVGTTFEGIFQTDFPADKISVPLPRGKWHLAARYEYQSGGDAHSVPMRIFFSFAIRKMI